MTQTNDGGAADLTTDALKRLAELRPIRDALGERGDLFMRLNGFYRVGPDGSGEPEFGYSDFRDSEYRQPIQQEAAEALRELIERREADERAALTPAPTAQEAVLTEGELDEAWKSGFNAGFGEAKLTDHPPQPSEKVAVALKELLQAVCGETGFAACVRQDSGRAYPWPALDAAEAKAQAALRALKGEQ